MNTQKIIAGCYWEMPYARMYNLAKYAIETPPNESNKTDIIQALQKLSSFELGKFILWMHPNTRSQFKRLARMADTDTDIKNLAVLLHNIVDDQSDLQFKFSSNSFFRKLLRLANEARSDETKAAVVQVFKSMSNCYNFAISCWNEPGFSQTLKVFQRTRTGDPLFFKNIADLLFNLIKTATKFKESGEDNLTSDLLLLIAIRIQNIATHPETKKALCSNDFIDLFIDFVRNAQEITFKLESPRFLVYLMAYSSNESHWRQLEIEVRALERIEREIIWSWSLQRNAHTPFETPLEQLLTTLLTATEQFPDNPHIWSLFGNAVRFDFVKQSDFIPIKNEWFTSKDLFDRAVQKYIKKIEQHAHDRDQWDDLAYALMHCNRIPFVIANHTFRWEEIRLFCFIFGNQCIDCDWMQFRDDNMNMLHDYRTFLTILSGLKRLKLDVAQLNAADLLSHLPNELIIKHIMPHLSMLEAAHLAFTNKRMADLIRNAIFLNLSEEHIIYAIRRLTMLARGAVAIALK